MEGFGAGEEPVSAVEQALCCTEREAESREPGRRMWARASIVEVTISLWVGHSLGTGATSARSPVFHPLPSLCPAPSQQWWVYVECTYCRANSRQCPLDSLQR